MSPEKTTIVDKTASSQEASMINAQNKYLDNISNSNIGSLIKYFSKEYNLTNFEDICGIPIAPELIPDKFDSEIMLSSEVTDKYNRLVEAINHSESAKEYPFLLLGEIIPGTTDSVVFYDLIPCCRDDYKPESTSVNYDSAILLDSANLYNVIAIGHTHPLLDESETCDVFTSKIKESDKEKFNIKQAGLNVSTQDIYQSFFVQEQLKNNKILECVIMYNGDLILIDMDGDELSKYPSIYGYSDNEVKISVPTFVNK